MINGSNSFSHLPKKERIIASAEYLFARRGYHNISIREIAKCSRLNSAMVNYYFVSKENLLLEILNSYKMGMEEMENKVNQKSNVWEAIKEYVNHISNFLISSGNSLRIIYHELLFPVSGRSIDIVNDMLAKQRLIFDNIFISPPGLAFTLKEIDCLYCLATGGINSYLLGTAQLNSEEELVNEFLKTKTFLLEQIKYALRKKLSTD